MPGSTLRYHLSIPATAMDFSRFRYLTFDCYGTLIDWESGILSGLRPIAAARGLALEDDALLELFGRLEPEAEAGDFRPYREVLERVVEGLAREFGFEATREEREALWRGLPSWPPFPDSREALSRLGERFRLVVISNVDDDLFRGSARQLGNPFHAVVTAQQAGAYKPSSIPFQLALERLGCDPGEVCHVAQSLYHDIQVANRLGLASVWINRRAGRSGGGATAPAQATPDLELPSLRALADRALGSPGP